jgi:hypothetical protein
MTHKNRSEPEVTLLVILLRTLLPFELSLCTYGRFRGKEIRGPSIDSLFSLSKLGGLALATVIRSNRTVRADIIKE